MGWMEIRMASFHQSIAPARLDTAAGEMGDGRDVHSGLVGRLDVRRTVSNKQATPTQASGTGSARTGTALGWTPPRSLCDGASARRASRGRDCAREWLTMADSLKRFATSLEATAAPNRIWGQDVGFWLWVSQPCAGSLEQAALVPRVSRLARAKTGMRVGACR